MCGSQGERATAPARLARSLLLRLELQRLPELPDSAPPTSSLRPALPPPSAARSLTSDKLL